MTEAAWAALGLLALAGPPPKQVFGFDPGPVHLLTMDPAPSAPCDGVTVLHAKMKIF